MYIIIFCAVVVAAFSGYLFRCAIERLIDEEVIITKRHPLSMIPPDIKNAIGISIFLFLMSIGVIVITINGAL